jgi:hypothetical protein
MIGDRMAGSVDKISRELPHRKGLVFMRKPKSQPEEVRASVAAMKGGKPSGARGRRKVETRRNQ